MHDIDPEGGVNVKVVPPPLNSSVFVDSALDLGSVNLCLRKSTKIFFGLINTIFLLECSGSYDPLLPLG
jgi:hypothetical protein